MLPVDKTSTASTDCLWGPRLTALLRRGSSTTWISWYKCVKVGSKAGRSSSRGLPGDQNGQRTRAGSRGDFSTRTMITTVCILINFGKIKIRTHILCPYSIKMLLYLSINLLPSIDSLLDLSKDSSTPLSSGPSIRCNHSSTSFLRTLVLPTDLSIMARLLTAIFQDLLTSSLNHSFRLSLCFMLRSITSFSWLIYLNQRSPTFCIGSCNRQIVFLSSLSSCRFGELLPLCNSWNVHLFGLLTNDLEKLRRVGSDLCVHY